MELKFEKKIKEIIMLIRSFVGIRKEVLLTLIYKNNNKEKIIVNVNRKGKFSNMLLFKNHLNRIFNETGTVVVRNFKRPNILIKNNDNILEYVPQELIVGFLIKSGDYNFINMEELVLLYKKTTPLPQKKQKYFNTTFLKSFDLVKKQPS